MTKYRVVIALCALFGAVLGTAGGYLLAPHSHRYTVSANVVLLPPANLTTVEASSFWEVLTRGQVTRTAAVVYADPRWLATAAKTAAVPEGELSLAAFALPDTTMLTATVVANSASAAESALNDVLTNATPEVTSLTAPFVVKVLWPQQAAAAPVPVPSRIQVAGAGTLGGLLLGGAIGWFLLRRRARATATDSYGAAAESGTDDANEALRRT